MNVFRSKRGSIGSKLEEIGLIPLSSDGVSAIGRGPRCISPLEEAGSLSCNAVLFTTFAGWEEVLHRLAKTGFPGERVYGIIGPAWSS